MGDISGTDIELGLPTNSGPSSSGASNSGSVIARCFGGVRRILSSLVEPIMQDASYTTDSPRGQTMQIEDYPAGYPRFSALIGSHETFHICRRFPNLRARLLLLQQDKLFVIEKRLEEIDRGEPIALRLGCSRKDNNSERQAVLLEIREALSEYDELIERNRRVFSLETAKPRNVANLLNWVNGNGCIARNETAYLSCQDLLSVTVQDDAAVNWAETLVGEMQTRLKAWLGRPSHSHISRDPNVIIYSKSSVPAQAARIAITPFIITLLLWPVIFCNYVEGFTARLIVIITATTMFVAILSGGTKVKTTDLAVAGATYTTVLIVFISTTGRTGEPIS